MKEYVKVVNSILLRNTFIITPDAFAMNGVAFRRLTSWSV